MSSPSQDGWMERAEMGTQESTTASTGPKVTVHIVTGRASRSSREMTGRTLLIGSDPECDVQMRSLEVGDHHCLLTRKPHAVTAKRLSADFPVLVNGLPISEQELSDGDTLKIGPFELRVSIEGLAAAEPLRPAPRPHEYERLPEPVPAPAPASVDYRPAPTREALEAFGRERRRYVPEAPTSASRAPRPVSRAANLARAETASPAYSELESESRMAPRNERAFESTSEVFKRLSNLKQNEIERQQREVHELRARLEKESAELQQLRRQLQQEKDSLARGYKEQARREQELQEKIYQLELRQEAQRATEQGIEHQRVLLTEEMLDFDHRKSQLSLQKQKLMRVREKLFQQYRERRQMVADLVESLEARAIEIQEQEKQAAIARSRAEGLEAQVREREHELAAREQTLARELEKLSLKNEELESEKARLAEEAEDLQHKQHSLEQLSEELNRRQQQLKNLETEVVEKDRIAQQELDQVRERSRELQRRLQEIEARSQSLDAQQTHLRELEESLEQQRGDQARRQRDLDARQAKVETLESELEFKQQEIQRREQLLRDQALKQKEIEQHLAKKREENDKETMDLQRRSTELEEQAQALYEELEQRRISVERTQKDAEQMHAQVKEARAKLEADQDAWTERVSTVREQTAEIAQYAAIIEQQRLDLDARISEFAAHTEELDHTKALLNEERKQIQAEREHLEHAAAQVREKHEALDAESDRLQELSNQLAQRQQDLVRRENAWCDDVKRRRRELEQQAEEIEQQRTALDRQIRAHRRQVHKLREVSLKVAQRKKESLQLLESAERNGQLREGELAALRDNHQELLDSMKEFADQAADRERELAALRDVIKSESSHLSRAHRQVKEQVRQLILDCNSGTSGELEQVQQRRKEIARQLESSLAEWSMHLSRIRPSEDGEPEAKEPAKAVPPAQPQTRLEPELEARPAAPPAVASQPSPSEPEPAIVATSAKLQTLHLFAGDGADSTEPATPSVPVSIPAGMFAAKPNVRLSEAEQSILDAAEKLELLDREAALAAVAPLMNLGVPFEEALIASEQLTEFQIAHLKTGNLGALKLGDVHVLDKVHADSIATTYRIRSSRGETPTALWLLEKRWCKDAQLRKTFEINVEPLTSLRHENVAGVQRVFAAGEQYGLVTEYVDGKSLPDLVPHGLPAAALVHYAWQAVRGLAAAHRAGFLHHNLRPRRILVDASNTVKLVGYGEPVWLSKIQRCENAKKIGRYVAPEEHAAGQPGDVRSDLYSLGQIFVELIQAVGADDLPHGFEALMKQLCHESPTQRCRSASEVLAMLEEMVNELKTQTPWPELPSVLEGLKAPHAEHASRMAA